MWLLTRRNRLTIKQSEQRDQNENKANSTKESKYKVLKIRTESEVIE